MAMLDSIEAVAVFLFFLPGIVGAILFLGIAETNEPGAWQAAALVIALSLIAAVLCEILFGISLTGGAALKADELTLQVLLDSYTGKDALIRTAMACLLAILAAVAHNKAWLYRLGHHLHLTQRTGAIDPWHQAFRQYNNKWARIRFKDGSKLVGWIHWYSEDGAKKELFLGKATWHLPTTTHGVAGITKTDVKGPGVFLSNFDEVIGIDFID